MTSISKILISTGILLIIAGLFWQFGGRFLNLGHLPGDIAIEKQNFRFYFPITTSIIISIIISGIMYLLRNYK